MGVARVKKTTDEPPDKIEMTQGKSKSAKGESPNNEPAKDKSGDANATKSGASPKEGTGSSTATAPARRPLGAKEIIPFAWKLVGTCQNTVLTLFKTVDRVEAEGQLARVQDDCYYTDLRVLENDTKVVQPKGAKAAKVAPRAAEQAAKKKKEPAKATHKAKRPAKKTILAARKVPTTGKAPAASKASPATKTSPKKTRAKSVKKSAKKKNAKKKSAAKTPKKTAKRRRTKSN